MEAKIRCSELRSRVKSAAEAAEIIKDGMTLALGGYTTCGYPKAIVNELVSRKNSGEKLSLRVVSASNDGVPDTLMADAGIISYRAPMIESKSLASQVNNGKVSYCEQQMCKMPRLLRTGAFGKIDVCVIEALCIREDGSIVPTSSVGGITNLVEAADRVIIEINTSVPDELEGMHDIFFPGGQPIPLTSCGQKIGKDSIDCPEEKISAIVFCDIPDQVAELAPVKPAQLKLADNLFNFLEEEMKRLGETKLPPIQTGFGNLAAEIVKGLGRSKFEDIEFFGGVAQEANIELLASGKAKAVSCGSVKMTERVEKLIKENKRVRDGIIIRNMEVTNSSEVISRLAPITLTSGIEMDIYGNVNSSHIGGWRVVNGLGGGAGFAQNAGLSVMMIVSENKGGAISTIVPMVSHQDISEHDIDIVVTENGVADLRGKSDVERAREIIENCSGSYKDALRSYLERAIETTGGHHPILLDEALSWHKRLAETGTMR